MKLEDCEVGMKVRITEPTEEICGYTGTIKHIESFGEGSNIAIEIDKELPSRWYFHSCDGYCKEGLGYIVYPDEIEPIENLIESTEENPIKKTIISELEQLKRLIYSSDDENRKYHNSTMLELCSYNSAINHAIEIVNKHLK